VIGSIFECHPRAILLQALCYKLYAQQPVPGDAAAGETLFFGKACGTCHLVGARGANVGPDLSNAALTQAQALRDKTLNPNANSTPAGRGGGGGASTVVVITKAARKFAASGAAKILIRW
jgi:cytochrome c551/c552